jgi:NAD(P)-dependent dehydrogenase (short-subunit alcohol dehydrogenase family)
MLCTLNVLPSMRARKSGCIITIASRAATVDTMLGLGYNDAKAAVTRAIHCLQLELELDGLGEHVHTYALHPGGVYTAMGASAHAPDVLDKYPDLYEKRAEFQKLFRDPPELCGQTCAYLATGKARDIRGMYFDCRQDVEIVCGYGRERLEKEGMNVLTVGFCEGYGNEP